MTDQESKEHNEEDQSLGEIVGEITGEVAESIGSVLSTVTETIENVFENVVKVETKNQTENEISNETDKKEFDENLKSTEEKDSEPVKDSDLKPFEETRLGYALNLPQADETEEEKVIVEPDDKNVIEAAIAKARPSGEEPEREKDELIAETLPELPRRNRARLQVQSPNRIFLYWSLANNPYETLHKAFGHTRAAQYTLVTKLVNLQSKAESYAPANLQGDWWYNVRSNARYRVDLGFYAPNRPFILLFSSNTVGTPRVAPSLRGDTAEDWSITKNQFQQVLEVSGYRSGKIQTAINERVDATSEDDRNQERSTILVARQLTAPTVVATTDLNLSELRWFIISLAAGASYEDLSEYLSEELVSWINAVLAANPNAFSTRNIRQVLESIFGADFVAAFAEEAGRERFSAIVFGASAIYFPEIAFPKLQFPELRPASQDLLENAFVDLDEDLLPPSSAEFIR